MMEYVWAFVTGGLICLIGQILLDTTKLTAPRILVIFVVSGVVLQALGLYEKLVELAGERDPLGYGDSKMYEYKFKKFLCSCALGMKPAQMWDGLDEANGGYIIVKANGEILAYHIYNRNFFEQYLLDNTILERASTSRHDYMSLYEEDGEMYIKLNLQVRFR